MKTDNTSLVGVHKFQAAGLGLAPFKFTGMTINLFNNGDGTTKPGGACDYCGACIVNEFHVRGADGREFKVGCDCINKVGDEGLIKAYKTSPQFRKIQAAKRATKAAAVTAELRALIDANSALLASKPHSAGYTDRQTGQPLTALDQYNWYFNNCGASGRARTLKGLKLQLAEFLSNTKI